MPRIQPLDPATANGQTKTLLDGVKKKLGMVPNFMKTMAHAPSTLAAYLAFSGAVAEGGLPVALRERIALVTAQTNGCDYCASAHQALGKMAGLDADEIARGFAGDSADPKAKVALTFARQVLAKHGEVSDAEIAAVKSAGYSDGDLVEIVANVALNIFTNYFNNVAEPDIDFPRVATVRRAA
ncbi:MAG: peroxidase-related enzyme [Hyphomicrobiales bacterium]